MIRLVAPLRSGLIVAFAAGGPLSSAVPSSAQQQAIRGRVIDPAGEPVAGQQVMLHRVTEEGGATIAQTVTDSAGSFELRAAEDVATGVFFVATRWQGSVQIGPMLRPPFPADGEYLLRIGAQPETGIGPVIPAAAPPSPPRQLAFSAAALVALLASMAWIGIRSSGPSRRRRLLARLARLEEAAASPDARAGERGRITDRLRPP